MNPLWRGPSPLLLASSSAVRLKLLEAAGVPAEASPAALDERSAERRSPERAPPGIARFLAGEKALAVSRAHPDRMVLGADQTLALGERRFNKPADEAGLREQLAALRGRTHHLHSGYALAIGGEIRHSGCMSAAMTMRAFSDDVLEAYVGLAGRDVLNSVGGYHYEEFGIHLFERVEGGLDTILGLPLLPVLAVLRKEGSLL